MMLAKYFCRELIAEKNGVGRNLRKWVGNVGVSLCCIGVVAPLQAEDLQAIYTLALENDPVYMAGFYQNEGSAEIYTQARAALFPSLNFEYSQTNTSQEIISADNTVFQAGSTSYPTREYTLSLNQSIYSYSNWANFDQAKIAVKRAGAELVDVRQDLLLRVAERYFAVLTEQDTYESVKAESAAAKEMFELVKGKRKNGLARMSDFLDAEARYMEVVAREVELQTRLNDSLQGLKEITGQLPLSLATLARDIPLIAPEQTDPADWVAMALETNPAVLARRYAVDVAMQEVKRSKGGHYPTLDLSITQNSSKTEGTLFGGGSDVATRDIMLKLKLPIYAGGGTSSRVREAEALYSKAKEELTRQSRKTERDTISAHDGVQGAIVRVEALQKGVESQMASVRAKTTAYKSGLATTLMVLDAERDLFLARVRYAQSRYDYILNTLRLKRAVGSLSEEDIHLVNNWLNG